MALSIFDRLLGRTETALSVVEPEAKASIGPGVFPLIYGTPLHTMSRDPHRLMAEAQALFHMNGWVYSVESGLGGRFLRLPWHLEDEDGKTIDAKSAPELRVPLKLLHSPAPRKTTDQLWSVTFRHMGLAGNGFWYLDQRDLAADTPLSLIYINPARMTPAIDSGNNVRGWVLDHPENPIVQRLNPNSQGVPLTVDEVIHFTFNEPDWGIWGSGWVEAAQRKIELDRLTDQHAGGVLASGGRLSGLVSPKAGAAVSDDQWVQFVRDWRSITSDPDAAKRLQIAKMPLDFTQMTASPKDLQLVDVLKANQETIFGMAGMPLPARGIQVPSGLNADLAEGFKEVVYETVKERSEPFREKVQRELLDRFQEIGVKVTLVIDYPEFEDRAPLFDAVAKSINVAMTNDERRAILSLEPLEDEELGKAVYIDGKLARIDVEPEPEPDPILPAPITPDEAEDVVEGKADIRKPLLGLRAKTETTWEPKIRRVVARVLGEQEKFVLSKLEHTLRKNDTAWWNERREHRRFMEALDPLITGMAREVANATQRTVKKPEGKADGFLDTVLDLVRASVGERITGINATTREKVQAAIAEGVEAGWSPAELGTRIRESAAFDEYRAELVSRTETMNVYNDAALRSYDALEVTEVEAIDGDTDDECARRNGKRYPISEAYGISDHPNGTLDWVPVVPTPAKGLVFERDAEGRVTAVRET